MAEFRGLFGMLGIQFSLTICKVNVLPTVLSISLAHKMTNSEV